MIQTKQTIVHTGGEENASHDTHCKQTCCRAARIPKACLLTTIDPSGTMLNVPMQRLIYTITGTGANLMTASRSSPNPAHWYLDTIRPMATILVLAVGTLVPILCLPVQCPWHPKLQYRNSHNYSPPGGVSAHRNYNSVISLREFDRPQCLLRGRPDH